MNTLSGLEFFRKNSDKFFCYYKNQLNRNEQNVYDKMREGFLSYATSIFVMNLRENQLKRIYEALKRDNPCLFFVEKVSYLYSPLKRKVIILPIYRFNKYEANATLNALLEKSNLIINCEYAMSDFEKEKKVHDYICEFVKYDYDYSKSSFECVGPLLFGKGVCDGISKATKFLFDLIDIKCTVVCGKATQENTAVPHRDSAHAWNCVCLDGVFYHLDITFDLSMQAYGIVRYDYFNLSDVQIGVDHNLPSNLFPKCTQEFNYYKRKGMFMHTSDFFKEYLLSNLLAGKQDVVFALPFWIDINAGKEHVANIVSVTINDLGFSVDEFDLISNDSQRVFHLHRTVA